MPTYRPAAEHPDEEHRQPDDDDVDEQAGEHPQRQVDARESVGSEVPEMVPQVLLVRRSARERRRLVGDEARVGVVGLVAFGGRALRVLLGIPRLRDHAERRGDVRAARHRREVLAALEDLPLLELLERAEVEGRGPDAAARAADPDVLRLRHVRPLVQAPVAGRRRAPATDDEPPQPRLAALVRVRESARLEGSDHPLVGAGRSRPLCVSGLRGHEATVRPPRPESQGASPITKR